MEHAGSQCRREIVGAPGLAGRDRPGPDVAVSDLADLRAAAGVERLSSCRNSAGLHRAHAGIACAAERCRKSPVSGCARRRLPGLSRAHSLRAWKRLRGLSRGVGTQSDWSTPHAGSPAVDCVVVEPNRMQTQRISTIRILRVRISCGSQFLTCRGAAARADPTFGRSASLLSAVSNAEICREMDPADPCNPMGPMGGSKDLL
jgi:hypothetical protein